MSNNCQRFYKGKFNLSVCLESLFVSWWETLSFLTFHDLGTVHQIPDLCLTELSGENDVANLGWDFILPITRQQNLEKFEEF